MCAATVEIFSENVIAKYGDAIMGQGKGVYNLRNYDPEVDISGVQSPESISFITLDLGQGVGRATIRTRQHDTSIDIRSSFLSMGIGKRTFGSSSAIILGEIYGGNTPRPVPIVDSDKNVLALITHKSAL